MVIDQKKVKGNQSFYLKGNKTIHDVLPGLLSQMEEIKITVSAAELTRCTRVSVLFTLSLMSIFVIFCLAYLETYFQSVSLSFNQSLTSNYVDRQNPEYYHGSHSCPVDQLTSKEGLKIAFVGERFHSWESYQRGDFYMGGEAYWAACLHFILRNFGYDVDFIKYFNQTDQSHTKYHRIIFDGYPEINFVRLMEDPELLCRSRVMHFWGGYIFKELVNSRLAALDQRLIITPYMDPLYPATPIPFFPHSLIYNKYATTKISRGRKGFILGKDCKYFQREEIRNLISVLLAAKFELHATVSCFNSSDIIVHVFVSPKSLSSIFQDMSFLFGLGDPYISPSPLEALANGVSFISPHYPNRQHPVLDSIGPPYVYKYSITNATSLLEAAELSQKYRFASYVPNNNKLESVFDIVCVNLLQNDGPCVCQQMKKKKRIRNLLRVIVPANSLLIRNFDGG